MNFRRNPLYCGYNSVELTENIDNMIEKDQQR